MEKQWYCALTLSALVHAAAFFVAPALLTHSTPPDIKKEHTIEVIAEPQPSVPLKASPAHAQALQEEIQKPPPFVDTLTKQILLEEKGDYASVKPKMLDGASRETVFADLPAKEELQKNTVYISYCRMVREKIRKNAYKYYESNEMGTVLLTFIIRNNGMLESLYLDDEFSRNDELVYIATQSIKNASPFAPFPEDLNYPRLQFDITIHFKRR